MAPEEATQVLRLLSEVRLQVADLPVGAENIAYLMKLADLVEGATLDAAKGIELDPCEDVRSLSVALHGALVLVQCDAALPLLGLTMRQRTPK